MTKINQKRDPNIKNGRKDLPLSLPASLLSKKLITENAK